VPIQSQRTALRRKKSHATINTMENTSGAMGVDAVKTSTTICPILAAT
jgi:hypothetical protein